MFLYEFLYRVGWSDHVYDKHVKRFLSSRTISSQFARKFDMKSKQDEKKEEKRVRTLNLTSTYF